MQPKANILIELQSAMNLWQNNAKPTHPKLKTEFMDTGHVNKHSYLAIVIYGCGYESSTQTKFIYYKL